jgi:hypothetical protein
VFFHGIKLHKKHDRKHIEVWPSIIVCIKSQTKIIIMKNIDAYRVYEWSQIMMLNLPVKRFIKDDEDKPIALLSSKNFHVKTYFEGYTFVLMPFTSKFQAVENEFSTTKVWRFLTIRNIEWEIRKLESYIWTLKVDFQHYTMVQKQEAELLLLKGRLLSAVRG